MKIRKGFVSNSSSSSFTCNICGETEGGYDARMDDFRMQQCEHGHIFHKRHADIEFPDDCSDEEVYNFLKKLENNNNYYKDQLSGLTEAFENNEFKINNYRDIIDEVIWEDGVPEEYCPVCKKLAEYEKDPEWKKYKELKIKFSDLHNI